MRILFSDSHLCLHVVINWFHFERTCALTISSTKMASNDRGKDDTPGEDIKEFLLKNGAQSKGWKYFCLLPEIPGNKMNFWSVRSPVAHLFSTSCTPVLRLQTGYMPVLPVVHVLHISLHHIWLIHFFVDIEGKCATCVAHKLHTCASCVAHWLHTSVTCNTVDAHLLHIQFLQVEHFTSCTFL